MATYTFDNGYGASVIDNGYGSHLDLQELAVLHDDHLCYKTPITDDVIGFLKPAEVKQLLNDIKALPPTALCSHRR